MTVLLMTSEPSDCYGNVNVPNWIGNPTGYSRGSIQSKSFGVPFYQPSSEFWFSYYTNYLSGDGLGFVVGLPSGRSQTRFRISDYTGTNVISLYKCDVNGNNVGAALASVTGYAGYPPGTKIDVNFKFAAAGFCRVYYGGTLILDYTGDTRGTTTEDVISGVFVGMREGAYTSAVWELIAHTSDTRKMRLATLGPNAAGDVNTFSSGAYTDVDESGFATTTDGLITNAAGAQFAFGLADLPTPPVGRGSWKVHAIRSVANAMATPDATPKKLAVGVRSAGSMVLSVAQTVPSGYANFHHIVEINPATGLPWTPTEVNALQIAGETAV